MRTHLLTCTVLLCLGWGGATFAAEDKKEEKKEEKAAAAPAGNFAEPSKLTEKAPDTFKAQFDTTKGNFTVEVTRAHAPIGADRFYNLVKS